MAVMLDVLTRADQLADHRPDLALEAAYLPKMPAWLRDQWPVLQRRALADDRIAVLVVNVRTERPANALAIVRLADLEKLIAEEPSR